MAAPNVSFSLYLRSWQQNRKEKGKKKKGDWGPGEKKERRDGHALSISFSEEIVEGRGRKRGFRGERGRGSPSSDAM